MAGYRAGDLEARYQELDVHEDIFVNYGFVSREVQRLMHPRGGPKPWTAARGRQVRALLDFVRAHGTVHPRAVDEHFAHGSVTNYWGGSSSATTHLLEAMHYRGLLRVARRDAGIRLYAAHEHEPVPKGTPGATRPAGRARGRHRPQVRAAASGQPVQPDPAAALRGAPVGGRAGSHAAAREAPSLAGIDRGRGLVLASERRAAAPDLEDSARDDTVRLLAPFDPVVWDRRRFEILWGWAYRFEAYTPAARRTFGYYALPLLWRDRVIGWANLVVRDGALHAGFGYVASRPPRGRDFRRALDEELDRVRAFLALR